MLTLAGASSAKDEPRTCPGCGSTQLHLDGSCAHCRRLEGATQPRACPPSDLLQRIEQSMEMVRDHCYPTQTHESYPTACCWDKAVPMGCNFTEHKMTLLDAFMICDGVLYEKLDQRCADWIVGDMHTANIVLTLPQFTPSFERPDRPYRGVICDRWHFYELKDMPYGHFAVGHKDDYALGQILNV